MLLKNMAREMAVMSKQTVVVVLLLWGFARLDAQDQTVGLFYNLEGSFEGYTLFAPLPYHVTYLIDHDGLLVNSWESEYGPGNAVYLLEDGTLLRAASTGVHPVFQAGGSGGAMQRFDWDGNLIWDFRYSDQSVHLHHDMEALPNGNILMIAWEYKSAAEAIAAGRSPGLLPEGELWPDHLIEVQPTGPMSGTIVWEWHVWDHLIQDFDPTKENYGIVEAHPELIDINYVMETGPNAGHPDWNHTNGIDYDNEFDQIVLSIREFSEIWVIDHSTTTEEAAGHTGGNSGKGGDLLYRWGNPEAYRAGGSSDRKFFCQHDAQWIATGHPGEGNILVFNNGCGRPDGNYSTVDEINPPADQEGHYEYTPGYAYGPEEQTWIYVSEMPEEFYSAAISGAERMPNGNTLICSGNWGTLFEVTPDGREVWYYINPVTGDGPQHQGDPVPQNPGGQGTLNMVFKTRRYASDFLGFEGHDLTPGDPVELDPVSAGHGTDGRPLKPEMVSVYPNPFSASTAIRYSLPAPATVTLTVYALDGRTVYTMVPAQQSAGIHTIVWEGTYNNTDRTTPDGVYILLMRTDNSLRRAETMGQRVILRR
jgi:hypothetical protein